MGPHLNKVTPPLKTGDKWDPSQMDMSQEVESSDLSSKDLDIKEGVQPKGGLPQKLMFIKVVPHVSDWMERDIYIVSQYWYHTDFKCFQKYQENFITDKDKELPNLSDHSDYLKVVCDMPGTIIKDCIFSVAADHKTLEEKGGDVTEFNKVITEKFPKAPKGSRYTDLRAVEITRVMLVIQCPNGVNVQYSDKDGFG